MSRWSARRMPTGILLVAVLASACTSGTSGVATGSPTRDVPASPSSVATAPATAVQSAGASAAPSGPSAIPSSAEPPPAALAAEGGDPVTGQLGSFTWGGGGSDSPWLPGSPITVGTGERLTVSTADGVGATGWTAKRVAAGSANGAGAVALGSGSTPITFDAPGAGAWSVQVTVRFAGNAGSAAYYWAVTVR